MIGLKKLLNNKLVYYAILALSALNVVGYLCARSYECLAIFAGSYYVCCQFQKNKVLCLMAALLVANVIFGCGQVREAFKEGACPADCTAGCDDQDQCLE